jgi:hypothetical protein
LWFVSTYFFTKFHVKSIVNFRRIPSKNFRGKMPKKAEL